MEKVGKVKVKLTFHWTKSRTKCKFHGSFIIAFVLKKCSRVQNEIWVILLSWLLEWRLRVYSLYNFFLIKKQTKFEITQFRNEIIFYNFPSILLLWHFQRQNKRYKMLLFLHGLYHYICCAGFSYNLFSSFPPYLGANKLLPAAHKFRMTMINQEKGLVSFVFVSELFKGR